MPKFPCGSRVYLKTSKWIGTVQDISIESIAWKLPQYYVLFDGATKKRWVSEDALMPELILKEKVIFT